MKQQTSQVFFYCQFSYTVLVNRNPEKETEDLGVVILLVQCIGVEEHISDNLHFCLCLTSSQEREVVLTTVGIFFLSAGYSDLSVQIPCQGRNFTLYTLVQRHPEAREQWYSVHFVNSQRFEEVGS